MVLNGDQQLSGEDTARRWVFIASLQDIERMEMVAIDRSRSRYFALNTVFFCNFKL